MEMNNPEIIERFKKGEIGIFPTDTAYGIGCRMDNEESLKKIYEIRNRPMEKALLVLVSSIEMAMEYVEISEELKKNLLEKYWPGGLTVILKCYQDKVPSIIRANGPTLAVRFPNNSDLSYVIQQVGVPIAAPSANYSGEPTPLKLAEVDQSLIEKVDFVINGVCTMEGVSTIIDASNGKMEIVRQGVLVL
jgi:L-threonylcarbamoyladenylate synthase